MSKNKYLRIFLPEMEAIVLIILQIVFVARPVLKIVEYLTTIHLSVPGSDDIYRAAKRRGKYPTLVYTKTVDSVERAR